MKYLVGVIAVLTTFYSNGNPVMCGTNLLVNQITHEPITIKLNYGKTFIVKGKLIFADDSSFAVGVNVFVKGAKVGDITDKNGFFEIQLVEEENKVITLVTNFIGVNPVEMEISLSEDVIDIGTLVLHYDYEFLANVKKVKLAPQYKWGPKGIWWKVTGKFKRFKPYNGYYILPR